MQSIDGEVVIEWYLNYLQKVLIHDYNTKAREASVHIISLLPLCTLMLMTLIIK